MFGDRWLSKYLLDQGQEAKADMVCEDASVAGVPFPHTPQHKPLSSGILNSCQECPWNDL